MPRTNTQARRRQLGPKPTFYVMAHADVLEIVQRVVDGERLLAGSTIVHVKNRQAVNDLRASENSVYVIDPQARVGSTHAREGVEEATGRGIIEAFATKDDITSVDPHDTQLSKPVIAVINDEAVYSVDEVFTLKNAGVVLCRLFPERQSECESLLEHAIKMTAVKMRLTQ